MQYKETPSELSFVDFDRILTQKILILVVSLLPSVLTTLYGLTLCFFQNEKKCLFKAPLFKVCAWFYVGVMIYGLYTIAYDFVVEHHHNSQMMQYMFYYNFLT